MLQSSYVRDGLLVRLRHGVYSLPTSIEDDLYTLTLSSPKIVVSHESALFLNGLSERNAERTICDLVRYRNKIVKSQNFRENKRPYGVLLRVRELSTGSTMDLDAASL